MIQVQPDNVVVEAAPIFDWKRRQNQLAKLYRAGKYESKM